MKHRTALAAVSAAIAATTFVPGAAHATAPLVIEDVRYDGTPELDQELSDLCGFPITVTDVGHFTGTVYFDSDGEFRLFTGRPSFRETFTSPYATVESADRGIDKISVTQDGRLLVFGTGVHLKVKGMTTDVGLWRLTFDLDTGELLSQEYHGHFDDTQPEIGSTLCTLLGPQS